MPAYTTILGAIFPVFAIMAAGFAFRRRGWMADELETDVMRLALRLLLPCLIIDMIAGNPALEKVSVAAWAIAFGFVGILIGYAVAFGVAKASRMEAGEGLRTFTITAGIQNYGFIALPVTIALFPDNTGPSGLIFIHGLGIEIAMWTIGIIILSRQAGPAWKLLINGPFIAVITGLILNYSGAHEWLPEWLKTTVHMIGASAIPISVFMIGATIGKFFSREILKDFTRVALTSITARLAIAPAIIIGLAMLLPIPKDLACVLAVQAGMPAAVMPIMIAKLYGGHPETAIKVVVATTAVILITGPLVIALAMRWLNLS